MASIVSAPLTHSVDLLILGGSTGAVEAALAAAEGGRSVLLVSPFTYLGEDICATLNFWVDGKITPATPLSRLLFEKTFREGGFPTPMAIKAGLETTLLKAGVDLLYNSYPVCLLRGGEGELAGAVIGNRSGFQAVLAPVILDSTERALAGHLTKAKFRPFEPGLKRFSMTVITRRTEALGAEEDYFPLLIDDVSYRAYRHTHTLELTDLSPLTLARAEVEVRLKSWDPKQVLTSDRVTTLHRDRLDSGGRRQRSLGEEARLDLDALRCGEDELYLLGPLADLSDEAAEALRHPCRLMAAGRNLGVQLAGRNKARVVSVSEVRAEALAGRRTTDLDFVRKDLSFRHQGAPAFPVDFSRLPLLASVDVAIAGGGTAGAPAGIASARAGASTLVTELLPCLGGVSTEGRISNYWFGNRCGFTDEIDRGVHGMGAEPEYEVTSTHSNPEWKKTWYLKALTEEGGQVLFHSLLLGAAVKEDLLGGMVIATPSGCGFVRASVTIDATGNSDLAAAAGAETVNIDSSHLAVQGTGLGPILPAKHYTNTDHTFVDDTDAVDTTRAFVAARSKCISWYDLVRIVNSRQRQQIVGDLTLEPLDFLTHRTFSDTLITARSNFDTHGFTIHPVFMAKVPGEEALRAHVPLRCLLPKGLERILVTGLGVSCHRDSLPVIRMQPDVQNQGYAAGYLAARAAEEEIDLRSVDIRAIQKHLVEVGILTPEVLGHTDSPPATEAEVTEAAESGRDEYAGLALLFARPAVSIPALKASMERTKEEAEALRAAQLLGLLGDASGAERLAAFLLRTPWDQGWNYRGMGQFGMSISPVDSLLVALGRTRSKAAAEVILKKAKDLTTLSEFSHVRALTLALESVPVAEAAPALSVLLSAASGHSCPSLREAIRGTDNDTNNTAERNAELKEIYLARALLACGDPDGCGRETLKVYSRDLHGHYARHARALLENHSAEPAGRTASPSVG